MSSLLHQPSLGMKQGKVGLSLDTLQEDGEEMGMIVLPQGLN
jgi:hypothetical protein